MQLLTAIGVVFVLLASGCGVLRVDIERFPIEVTTSEVVAESVPVYDAGMYNGAVAGIPLASLHAVSTTFEPGPLKRSIGRKAATLGADFVVVEGRGAATGPTVTNYAYGVAVSNQATYGTMSAVAYVRSPVTIGLRFDPDTHSILDVVPGSPAASAGVRITERILALNGTRVGNDRLAVARVLAKAKPGDRLKLELTDLSGNQREVTLVAAENSGPLELPPQAPQQTAEYGYE